MDISSIKLFLKVDKFNPLKGDGYIDLPQNVKTERAVMNIKSKDN